MTDATRVKCLNCSREILVATANRNGGYFKPCKRNSDLSESEQSERDLFEQIDAIIEPFSDYPDAIERLAQQPVGLRRCFAFHYVNAEILNSGISQLYGNSTWFLMPDAIDAAETARQTRLPHLLALIVFYYHRRNKSRLKRRIDETIFDAFDKGWNKSLKQLDDEYFSLENATNDAIPTLCSEHRQLLEPKCSG